jgi:hypothetical protein
MANIHFSASGTEDHIVKLLKGSDIPDKIKMLIEDQMKSRPGHNWAIAITANDGATSQSLALNVSWFQLIPEAPAPAPAVATPTAEREDGR